MGKSSGGIRSVTNAELGAVTVGNVRDYIDGGAVGYELLGRVNRANSWIEMARADTETRMFESDRKQLLRYLKKRLCGI